MTPEVPCAYCGRMVLVSCLPSRFYAECWDCLIRDRGRVRRHRGSRVVAWLTGRVGVKP